MNYRVWAIGVAMVALSGPHARAQTAAVPSDGQSDPPALRPAFLLDDSNSPMYPRLAPPRDDNQLNNGGVHFDLTTRYLDRYVYRGIDQSTLGEAPENALQFDAKLTWDLGKLPHPFVGLFVNVFNEDPISRFEEVRPFVGMEWTIKPLTFAGGLNAYLYPNRKPLDTSEVWASLSLDDSRIFRTERPVLQPYIYAAYDVSLYHGFYFEAGVKHDFIFEDLGLTISPQGDAAYVLNNRQFARPGQSSDTGFQHYDIGVVGDYSLNTLFNFSSRYGQWSIQGYLFYTADISNHLRGNTLIWGGVGLAFSY